MHVGKKSLSRKLRNMEIYFVRRHVYYKGHLPKWAILFSLDISKSGNNKLLGDSSNVTGGRSFEHNMGVTSVIQPDKLKVI
jgi:hypothetical protein